MKCEPRLNDSGLGPFQRFYQTVFSVHCHIKKIHANFDSISKVGGVEATFALDCGTPQPSATATRSESCRCCRREASRRLPDLERGEVEDEETEREAEQNDQSGRANVGEQEQRNR